MAEAPNVEGEDPPRIHSPFLEQAKKCNGCNFALRVQKNAVYRLVDAQLTALVLKVGLSLIDRDRALILWYDGTALRRSTE